MTSMEPENEAMSAEKDEVKPEEQAPAEQTEQPEEAKKADDAEGAVTESYSAWQRYWMKKGFVFAPKVKVKKPLKQNVIEWAATILGALLLVFVIKTFVGEPVIVSGNSMYPTLHDSEMMIVSKLEYGTSYIFNLPIVLGGEPERFDVVVCRYPDRGDTNFVKRIVGLPGDTIQIEDGYLYVNGVKYTEKFLSARMTRDYGPYTVPEGHYFVMGDNRNNSNDSRNSQVGAITRDMIIGHVTGVLWHQIPSTLEDWGLKTD